MKKLLFVIIIIITLNSYAQDKTTVLPDYNSTTFTWKGGNGEYYDVGFVYSIEKKIDKEMLDRIVMTVMTKSKHFLKNKYSFIPKRFTIIDIEGVYKAISEFVGENSSGVEGVTKLYFTIDTEGNVFLNY
tara:strand:- start:378 stop:767 length:390 start_codon:yes stop_codon:yes gene_type:complete